LLINVIVHAVFVGVLRNVSAVKVIVHAVKVIVDIIFHILNLVITFVLLVSHNFKNSIFKE